MSTSEEGAALVARIEAEERRKVALLSRKQDIGEQICILQIRKDAEPGAVDALRDERARIDQELFDFDKLITALRHEREVIRRGELIAAQNAGLAQNQTNSAKWRAMVKEIAADQAALDEKARAAEKLRNTNTTYAPSKNLWLHRERFPDIPDPVEEGESNA